MIIKIDLSNNREVVCDNTVIGKTFENNATILHFNLTKDMADKWFYLEFEKPNGNKFISSKLDVIVSQTMGAGTILNEEYYVEYEIPSSLLNLKGELKVEAVLKNESNLVFKTYTMKFNILNSINAGEEIPKNYPDFVSETQKVINLIETDGEGNQYLADDGTYKEVQSGSSDYDSLENKPFTNMTGTEENPIFLRTLQTGAYVLSGVCSPYDGSEAYMVANNAITYVNYFETVTAVQIFYPPYNQVQYFEVYDDNYITNTVALNNLVTKDYVDGLINELREEIEELKNA